METEIVAKGISPEEVNGRIAEIWADQAFRERLEGQGVPIKDLIDPPIEARPSREQSGIAGTILLAVASGLATHVAKLIFDAMWAELKRRYGARLTTPPGKEDR